MKKEVLFTIPALMLALSCEQNKPDQNVEDGRQSLPMPSLTVENQTGTSFSVAWSPVDNASGYTYEFQDETRSITDNRIAFDNLTTGEYVVRVRADAPRHSTEWTSSGYAEITVALDGNVISVETKNVTWNSVRVVCSVNTGITYIYDILTKEFYQTFGSDEEMVASYMDYVASQGVPVSMILKMRDDSTDLFGLLPSTDYMIFAVGMDADGNVLSDVFMTEFTTDEMPDADPELVNWFGTWTATSAQTLRWTMSGDGQSVDREVLDEPMTFDIEIYGDPANYQQALIDGWASCKDYPALAVLNYNDGLEVYSGVVMDAADERGLAPTWGTWAYIEAEDRYTLIKGQFPAYTFTMEGDAAFSTLYSAMMNGSMFETVSLDIFAVGDAGWTVYLDDNGAIPDMPAGEITLVRSSSSAQSPFYILNNY